MYDPCLDPGIGKKKEKEYLWRNEWSPNEFCNSVNSNWIKA